MGCLLQPWCRISVCKLLWLPACVMEKMFYQFRRDVHWNLLSVLDPSSTEEQWAGADPNLHHGIWPRAPIGHVFFMWEKPEHLGKNPRRHRNNRQTPPRKALPTQALSPGLYSLWVDSSMPPCTFSRKYLFDMRTSIPFDTEHYPVEARKLHSQAQLNQ